MSICKNIFHFVCVCVTHCPINSLHGLVFFIAAHTRDELEEMIQARVHDLRVDSRLQRTCRSALASCAENGFEGDEADLLDCLQVGMHRDTHQHAISKPSESHQKAIRKPSESHQKAISNPC
jgi:hypothetical protein